jgi:hypothetical protein
LAGTDFSDEACERVPTDLACRFPIGVNGYPSLPAPNLYLIEGCNFGAKFSEHVS